MRILVADDDCASRTILSSLISQAGHQAVLAEDGSRAWEIMEKQDAPSIAILDWLMPGIDGESLCRKIRAEITRAPIYIIMLTIKGSKDDIVRGLDAGANDYLSKPYDPGELFSRLRVGLRTIDLENRLSGRIMDLEINERKVQTLLAEKELILFEVHHRIKNNMSMIVNLLTLQIDSMKNKEAIGALRNAIGRLKAMGVLYDKLYRSDDVNAISLADYLPSLIEEIISVFPDRYKVEIDTDIENIKLDVQRISCVGMIVNELISNTMKHAFTERGNGAISIGASHSGDTVTILYEDDGSGIPPGISVTNPQTFGLKLIAGLAAQIDGALDIDRERGTRVTLTFPI